MPETTEKSPDAKDTATVSRPTKQVRRSRLRKVFWILLILIVPLIAARLALPGMLRWYVNRTLDRSPQYEGRIGGIDVHLWRGAYTINDIRLLKRSGNVPVPLLDAKHIDLAVEWKSLVHGSIVGRVLIDQPSLNFVDAPDPADTQTGVGPWLQIIRDLFPFRINSAKLQGGTVHFLAYQVNPPVDVYLDHLDATVDNLTNIHDDVTPMYATVNATGLAMGHAKFQYKMKLDPFSYKPTFQMGVQLIGLDVRKVNQLARTYGKFDFERGWFDLVVEADCKEGAIKGYIKPLFRNLQIFTPQDVKEDNAIVFFWEALVGTTAQILKNAPRDQFGTMVPFTGEAGGPKPDILASLGNLLRNAFIRAYLPQLDGVRTDQDEIQFDKGSIVEATSVGDTK